MLALFIIFVVSLVAVVGMLFFRAWEIRRGFVQPEGESVEDKIDVYLTKIGGKIGDSVNSFGHEIILFILRTWVRVTYAIRKTRKKVRGFLSQIFKKALEYKGEKGELPRSGFLRSIAEYKQKMKEMEKEIEKEEPSD